MKYSYLITVTGERNCSPFPIDMLRYDRYRPKDESESNAITRSIQTGVPERPIRLRGEQEPTTARWASFGWLVTDIERQRV